MVSDPLFKKVAGLKLAGGVAEMQPEFVGTENPQSLYKLSAA
jgi:hypothetical protein